MSVCMLVGVGLCVLWGWVVGVGMHACGALGCGVVDVSAGCGAKGWCVGCGAGVGVGWL